jgi:hypothetical protein
VKVLRPDITTVVENIEYRIKNNLKIAAPGFMQPRDHGIMIGDSYYTSKDKVWGNIKQEIIDNGSKVFDNGIVLGHRVAYHSDDILMDAVANGAMTTRVGKDLYFGTNSGIHSIQKLNNIQSIVEDMLPNHRIHMVDTQGHNDGCFCPAVPGLIFSIIMPINYKETFPDWEVVYLPNESWSKMKNFLTLKKKNYGKWWVPGEELNDDFTNFVETWMNHWVGYAEESVFDVNMLMIDKKNAIVNGYNKLVFDAFDRYGITPHICNFRHRYFWDGGLHCITSDLHREGVMEDYFPERS